MKSLYKITFLISTLLFVACKEDLPNPTQNGSNTVACKVNGKVWKADAGTSFNGKKFSLLYSDLLKPRKRFVLYANRITDNENSNIMLAVADVKTTGTQYFNFDTAPYPGNMLYENHAAYFQYKPNQVDYITNSRVTGSITFTRVDTINYVLSGVFEFTAENTDGSGQTVKVNDGRFDIKY